LLSFISLFTREEIANNLFAQLVPIGYQRIPLLYNVFHSITGIRLYVYPPIVIEWENLKIIPDKEIEYIMTQIRNNKPVACNDNVDEKIVLLLDKLLWTDERPLNFEDVNTIINTSDWAMRLAAAAYHWPIHRLEKIIRGIYPVIKMHTNEKLIHLAYLSFIRPELIPVVIPLAEEIYSYQHRKTPISVIGRYFYSDMRKNLQLARHTYWLFHAIDNKLADEFLRLTFPESSRLGSFMMTEQFSYVYLTIGLGCTIEKIVNFDCTIKDVYKFLEMSHDEIIDYITTPDNAYLSL